MAGDAGSGALVAAFGPWHPNSDGPARAGLVELHSPAGREVARKAG